MSAVPQEPNSATPPSVEGPCHQSQGHTWVSEWGTDRCRVCPATRATPGLDLNVVNRAFHGAR